MLASVLRGSFFGLSLGLLLSCGDGPAVKARTTAGGADAGKTPGHGDPGLGSDAGEIAYVPTDLDAGPAAGTTADECAVPSEARAEDVSAPTTVVGDGSVASCTSSAFVAAVAKGGVITFDCGPDPITITLEETAKVFNDKGPKIVIDGGGKVTLSGAGRRRILYMSTCDEAQRFTTSHCDNQDHPQLTVQNLTFVDGNAKGLGDADGPDFGGGGAVYALGGRLKIVNSRFFHNVCDDAGPDVGGGAVRGLMQYDNLPLYVVHSTFGGSGELGNVCSNGGALSGLHISYTLLNSVLSQNRAIGSGANPARPGTPGGGSGGAVYMDGNTINLELCGVEMRGNDAKEGGGAIFFVSNDGSGSLAIGRSTLSGNLSSGFESDGYPGIFWKTNGTPGVSGSTIEK